MMTRYYNTQRTQSLRLLRSNTQMARRLFTYLDNLQKLLRCLKVALFVDESLLSEGVPPSSLCLPPPSSCAFVALVRSEAEVFQETAADAAMIARSGVAVADEIFHEDLPPAQAPYALPRPLIVPQPNGGTPLLAQPPLPSPPRSSVTWSAQNPNFVVPGQRALCLFTDTGDEDDLYLPGVIESMHEGSGEEVEFVFFSRAATSKSLTRRISARWRPRRRRPGLFESGDVQVADPSYLREVAAKKTTSRTFRERRRPSR